MEDAIIHVTSHGKVQISESDMPEFFLPEGMTLLLLSTAAPGVCNIMSSETSHYFTHILKSREDMLRGVLFHASRIRPGEKLREPYLSNMNKFISIFKEYDRTNAYKPLLSTLTTTADEDERKYVHHFDKSYLLTVYKGGDLVQNKTFERVGEEMVSEIPEKTWDYKVNLVNYPGQPDLISKINKSLDTTRSHDTRVSTLDFKDLMYYLNELGTKNVFILDSSCDVLVDRRNRDLHPTAENASRRNSLKRKLEQQAGKRKRKQKKTRAKKRANKRKTLKRIRKK